MENQIQKFIEFNGQMINFIAKYGQYWIAIKPICEALGVDYETQRLKLRKDKILGSAPCVYTVQVDDDQRRKMLCLPEFFIYGWLFKIQSNSPKLAEYQWKCYEILYKYFHGAITGRRQIIKEKLEIQFKKRELEEQLLEIPIYQQYQDLNAAEMRTGKALKDMDTVIINEQLSLFEEMKK